MEIPDQEFQKSLIVNVKCIQKDKIEKQLLIGINYLTYDKFIKKILRNIHIPVKHVPNSIMKIEHMGIPIIVHNDCDLAFIIRSLLLNNESINVSITFTQNTQQTKQQIVFNEDGEKMNEEFALNEPSDPRYAKKQKKGKQTQKEKVNRSFSVAQSSKIEEDLDEDEVFCAFCKESVNNLEYIKKLGWFYGPYKQKKHIYYVHLMCAIWSPAIYLQEETNKMINVKKEIQRSNKILCKYCGSFGGGLGCKVADCKQSFHFKCALSEDIDTRLDHQKFELYCPNHAHILDQKIQDEIEKVHCEKCQIDENEELILLCDNCDKAFHTYCLENKLDSVPHGDWFCPECLVKNPRLKNHLPSQLLISYQTEAVLNQIQKSNSNSQVKKVLSQNSQTKMIQSINSQNNNLQNEVKHNKTFLIQDLQNIQYEKNQQQSFQKIGMQINESNLENLWDVPLSPIEKKGLSKQQNNLFDVDN
ncbi:hypothetical protein ABPG72_006547 [Tetrahymena utriculariae]